LELSWHIQLLLTIAKFISGTTLLCFLQRVLCFSGQLKYCFQVTWRLLPSSFLFPL
jgi:hypothetical protein